MSVLWPNGQRDHTRGICHVVTEGHFKGLCVYAWAYTCPVWEEDGKTGWEYYKSMMCCCRRIIVFTHKRQQPPESFSCMLIYLISTISTTIHTLKIRLLHYTLNRNSLFFFWWVSISRLCLCFCSAKSLNKEVISWTTFLFVLSSISFQSNKRPKAHQVI